MLLSLMTVENRWKASADEDFSSPFRGTCSEEEPSVARKVRSLQHRLTVPRYSQRPFSPTAPPPRRSTQVHRRNNPFTTLPKYRAMTVLERMMTLYGMLKSGVGILNRVVGVWSCRTGWRARREESVEFSSPTRRGGGEDRSKTVAPGMEKPRFESAGYSVYQRLAAS